MATKNNTPYTYLIGWKNLNKYYYGVRYAHDCDPSDLWKTYFTSSNYVKEYVVKHGQPDVIQVRKTFNTGAEAMLWESKFLTKVNAMHNESFLNKQINGNWCMDIETRMKISSSHKAKNIKRSDEFKRNISEKNSGKIRTEQQKLNMSIAKTGSIVTEDHKMALSLSGKSYWDKVRHGEIKDHREKRKIKIKFEGKVYESYKQAMRETGKTYYTLNKYGVEV